MTTGLRLRGSVNLIVSVICTVFSHSLSGQEVGNDTGCVLGDTMRWEMPTKLGAVVCGTLSFCWAPLVSGESHRCALSNLREVRIISCPVIQLDFWNGEFASGRALSCDVCAAELCLSSHSEVKECIQLDSLRIPIVRSAEDSPGLEIELSVPRGALFENFDRYGWKGRIAELILHDTLFLYIPKLN